MLNLNTLRDGDIVRYVEGMGAPEDQGRLMKVSYFYYDMGMIFIKPVDSNEPSRRAWDTELEEVDTMFMRHNGYPTKY